MLEYYNLTTQRQLKKAILEFGAKRDSANVGFVYYAGHGVQVNNENYLLPTQEEYTSQTEVIEYAVSVQSVLRALKSDSNQVNILVLDACRDNPFESNWNKTRSLKGGGLAKTPPPKGSLIAYSTDHGQTAADGEGENSIYSKALAKNLLIENISIEQVFKNVRTEVLNLSNNKQSTVEESKLTGEVFYLNKKEPYLILFYFIFFFISLFTLLPLPQNTLNFLLLHSTFPLLLMFLDHTLYYHSSYNMFFPRIQNFPLLFLFPLPPSLLLPVRAARPGRAAAAAGSRRRAGGGRRSARAAGRWWRWRARSRWSHARALPFEHEPHAAV